MNNTLIANEQDFDILLHYFEKPVFNQERIAVRDTYLLIRSQRASEATKCYRLKTSASTHPILFGCWMPTG